MSLRDPAVGERSNASLSSLHARVPTAPNRYRIRLNRPLGGQSAAQRGQPQPQRQQRIAANSQTEVSDPRMNVRRVDSCIFNVRDSDCLFRSLLMTITSAMVGRLWSIYNSSVGSHGHKFGPGERARVTKARFNAMYASGL